MTTVLDLETVYDDPVHVNGIRLPFVIGSYRMLWKSLDGATGFDDPAVMKWCRYNCRGDVATFYNEGGERIAFECLDDAEHFVEKWTNGLK